MGGCLYTSRKRALFSHQSDYRPAVEIWKGSLNGLKLTEADPIDVEAIVGRFAGSEEDAWEFQIEVL